MKLAETWLQSIIFNPFRDLREAPPSPHSRTLRTGFFGKVKDAYFALSGTVSSTHPQIIPGIFDWLTVGIARTSWVIFINNAIRASEKTGLKKVSPIVKAVVSSFLAIPLLLVRFVFGVVATAATLPVTAIVSFTSFLASRKLKKQAEALELPTDGPKRTLGAQQQMDNVDITVEKKEILVPGSHWKVGLQLKINRIDLVHISEESFKSPEISTAQKQSIAALLKLNVGNVLFEAEKVSPGTCKQILDSAECTRGMLRG